MHADPQHDRHYALIERQVELEDSMRGLGIKRYWARVTEGRRKRKESHIPSVRRLVDASHEQVVEGIQEYLHTAGAGTPGKHQSASRLLELLEPEAAALLTLRTALNGLSGENNLVTVARELGALIEDELRFRKFKAAHPGYMRAVVQRAATQTSCYKYQRAVVHQAARKKEVDWCNWSAAEQALVGTKLLEIMVERTGLFHLVLEPGRKGSLYKLQPSDETLGWLAQEDLFCEALAPVYLPMLVEPRPWTSVFEGGYLSRCPNLVFVRGMGDGPVYSGHLEELSNTDLSQVMGAVNQIQATPWRVNRRVYEVVRHLWDTPNDLGLLPDLVEKPFPPRPAFMEKDTRVQDLTPEQSEIFVQWRKAVGQRHDRIAAERSRRIRAAKVLWLAELFLDEEAIWFPHHLDFRGRCYPAPPLFNPQGCDLARALLTFARGEPVGDAEGARWLAVHGARLWGVDKVGLEARETWVKEHQEQILACAEDPLTNLFWTKARKPWQALAFCFEWAGFCREGYAYVSCLPVQMDGSCNGLQNFSALLRDEVGGTAVNLVPMGAPQDVYQRVMDSVVPVVEADAAGHPDPKTRAIAQGWLGHCTREVGKRPVMTFSYGACRQGYWEQIGDDIVDRWTEVFPGAALPWDDKAAAARYMGDRIWEAVGKVVIKAAEAMQWLQAVAAIASDQGLPVRWTTPAGLVVQQHYQLIKGARVNLTFGGKLVRPRVNRSVVGIDKRRQKNGIAPNFVHSLDAAHLMLTVLAAGERGLHSFSVIHDSYGTHAGKAAELARILREQFITMYTPDLLQKFRDEILEQLPPGHTLPPVPERGSLDLEQIRESVFFFS